MYRRSSIGFLLRGVSIALIFIVIPLLLLRILENIALMVHNFKFSKIIGKLYVPVLIICSLASLSVILERLSIFYIASNRENRGIIFGILTNISTSAVIAILISLILYNLVPLSYIIVLCLGIVSSSVIPVIFFRLRRRIQILISLTVIYTSLIPILQLITSKVGGVSSLTYVPPILLIISILADIRENIKKILAKITFIILVVVLLSTYVVSARSIIFSLVFSRDPALSYVMDSLIISLILIVSLIIVNILFGSERPLIIETLESLDKVLDVKLDYLSIKVRERLREFLKTGDKVPLLCSIVELGKYSDNVDNIEQAVRIVEEYSDIKVPPLALKWQVELINYKNLARRLALLRAVIDILRGHRSSEEELKGFASESLISIPQVSLMGIVQKIFTLLIVIVPIIAVCLGLYLLVYLIPILVTTVALFPDVVVFPRRYLISQVIHAYNKYLSLVSSRRHVRDKRV